MTAVSNQQGAAILVVDDEPDLRTLYELTLLREGYRVDVAENLAQARERLAQARYEVLITDMRLPDGEGVSLVHELRSARRPERSVVITAFGSAENAVESLKAGAFDYLTKPVDLRQLRTVIASAVQERPGPGQAAGPSTSAGVATDGLAGGARRAAPSNDAQAALDRLVGSSAPMRQVRDRIQRAARSMAPVLIWGESGTGKEITAQALHANSHRGRGPLVAVNCGAIPENLLESEFFGVKKGAYTGATADREGYFQAARGGTLFLDEIGDLPLSMQSKLLRAIQERRVRPVGATQEDSVDVRIVSATHKALGHEVRAGRFRQDLYYRLNVISIHLPPLRERREDLPDLCGALLQRIADESGLPTPRLTEAVLAQIARQRLPGNVRELENLLHRAVALSEGPELSLDAIDTLPGALGEPAQQADDEGDATQPAALPVSLADPFDPDAADDSIPPRGTGLEHATEVPLPTGLNGAGTALPSDLQTHLDRQERQILIQALQATGYNRTAAAARLGLSLRQIRYRIARLRIDMPQGPEASHDA